jgi:hypothetical protein
MTVTTAASLHAATRSPMAPGMYWPLQDGAAALDELLAEAGPRDTKLIDAMLDLRVLCTANKDAGACVEQLMRVRRLLDGRCYLAFYRVRRWARRVLRVQVRSGRGAVWISRELPSDAARVDEIVNTALAAASHSGSIPATAQARFVFAVKPSPPSMRAPC